METGTLISLGLYFLAMLGIGLYGYKTSTDDMSGYMLGGRKLSPSVTALSAGASDMSGWMLMGVPGAMYLSGVSSSWIAIGLLVGAYINYIIVAPRLRVYTEVANDSITLPDYFENRFADKTRLLRIVSSVVIVIFFTLYTSSGVVGGGKLFESSFGLSYELGLYVTAGVVVAYTLFGGFLAVSITDFVQGCIMFISLVLVPVVALDHLGGISSVFNQVSSINTNFSDMFVDANTGEALTVLGIISLLSWGLGYFGQPHIIVRFMAIRSVRDIKTARRIGISWMLITLLGAVMTGLVGIAYVANTKMTLNDPETIFIVFSQFLFHPLISGFLLAAILAAIMSTISSQLLVTSSSLTEDFYKTFVKRDASQRELVLVGRLSVLAVALVAIILAYDRESSILTLVSNAWAGFGAAFGPLVVLSLYWQRMTFAGALAGILSGAATVLFWIYAPVLANDATLSSLVYEILPGVIVSTLSIIIVSKLTSSPAPKVTELFAKMQQQLKQA
ncbi:MAG: sodium/proline symporter PutP [Gammaproteobacteria bacterium]|nr:sodium/proline symporter PutP [Gammaproteobacteria bacterium]MBU1554847.1 sodium/proline symporter PutP [Gammaproteobacteria bacterium]MBU2071798.1 sodium/proline symporter PutP [Gammaproteobacteria bacterium]MBU2184134.1 sodium/proline symporter PutP [Gammaproteobacteria bacterium]MBU2204287.1 sodium/proline symporter PutP [Gammaproteobacteria bacterium]